MNDTQITPRQMRILQHLSTKPSATRKDIEAFFSEKSVSRVTLIRDLKQLIQHGWVKQTGGGRYVSYMLSPGRDLLLPMDLNAYFQISTDSRYVRYPTFHTTVISKLTNLFLRDELQVFEQGRQQLADRFAAIDPAIIKRELERFTIEFSWKSSQIEGNTYSLLETEELIKNKKEAQGHTKEEAIMILNHKSAFDTILSHKSTFQDINGHDIRQIHAELVKNFGIASNIREHGVGITGTTYIPLDNKWQIEESLSEVIKHAAAAKHVPEKSLIFLAMISYLQPFIDGNKRTARMMSNAVLLANGYYPLSYRSVDEVEFKKALILFYEQNNLYHLKRIFLEQQQFAIEKYFM